MAFKRVKNILLFLLGLRSSKRHVYVFNKSLWYQDELNYEEDGRVREVIKAIFGSGITPEKFGEAIDMLYEKGAIPNLLEVVLKPYEPTFLHSLWNRRHVPENGIIPHMKNSEIAVVLSDFFFFNTRWMSDLTTMLPGLGLKSLATMMTSMQHQLTK